MPKLSSLPVVIDVFIPRRDDILILYTWNRIASAEKGSYDDVDMTLVSFVWQGLTFTFHISEPIEECGVFNLDLLEHPGPNRSRRLLESRTKL
jgi:hypothetical protein